MMFQWRIAVASSVLCLLWLGVTTDLKARNADVSKGKSIYREVCQTCHGLNGTGSGTMTLQPPAADLTSAAVQEKLDAGLFKAIHDGRKNTAMGAWKYSLSDEEILDVIAFVRTLGGGATALPKP
ncbi:MAG TPA: cytochrome c [Nitrospira sp.]|jgi:mono/diheme cytochrome c family protein|nr:cytochrome c [Nitrospira sp.]